MNYPTRSISSSPLPLERDDSPCCSSHGPYSGEECQECYPPCETGCGRRQHPESPSDNCAICTVEGMVEELKGLALGLGDIEELVRWQRIADRERFENLAEEGK